MDRAEDVLAMYRAHNAPDVGRLVFDSDFGAALNEPSPQRFGRGYAGYWETRNLRMASKHTRRADGAAWHPHAGDRRGVAQGLSRSVPAADARRPHSRCRAIVAMMFDRAWSEIQIQAAVLSFKHNTPIVGCPKAARQR